MEIVVANNNDGLIAWHALDIIGPPAAKLDGCFNCFCARVHWQQLVISKSLSKACFHVAQLVIIKGPGRQGQLAGLVCQGLEDCWVSMPLIDCRIGAEKV